MKKIKVGKTFTIVDDDDFERCSNLSLSLTSHGYVCSYFKIKNCKYKRFYLHRFIMDAPHGKVVDHINHNKLDNRKSNLRICSYAENTQNSASSGRNTSGFRGVYFCKRNNNWVAQIKFLQNRITLGSFNTPQEASIVYERKASELFPHKRINQRSKR